jgi:type VI secretion system protein ImpA
VEPDWKRVKAATLELLAQTRDLRLAVWLTRSLVVLHGVAGLADGCALIEGWLTRYWDDVYPQLDEREVEHEEENSDGDPTARLNVLLALNDPTGLVRELGVAPLIGSPGHGGLSLCDVEQAEGEARSGAAALAPGEIDAAFADAPFDVVVALDEALIRALQSLHRIDALLTERLGPARAIAMTALEQLLRRAGQTVRAQRARHPASARARPGLAELPEPADADVIPAAAHGAAIASRADVLRTLDRLCAYYAQAEPSSAVPLLLERARRLVGMRFVEAVADLAPAGVEQAKHWAGATLE